MTPETIGAHSSDHVSGHPWEARTANAIGSHTIADSTS